MGLVASLLRMATLDWPAPDYSTLCRRQQTLSADLGGRGADPVIPVRRNGKPWTKDGPGVDTRNEALRAMKRLGRTIWKKWSGYHRRSLVETKMYCFKLLG